jgi:hypothetical protein
MPRREQKIKMPRGLTYHLATTPPKTVWPLIMEAIPVFGLSNLYVYAPKEAFMISQKADPAIIAENNGNLYLIAVWE